MPSPFPGMNPYLEQSDAWEDFHQEFLTRARSLLADQVEPDYIVKVAVRLYIHELSAEERRYFGRADTAVAYRRGLSQDAAVAEIAAPVKLMMPATEIVKTSWLEVRDRRDRRVVTVIELLSPINKDRTADREAYLAKRNVVLASQTHLIEIDLRRGGERPALPKLPECDYYALVSRYEHRPVVGFWPIHLRERLPVIPVPLSGADSEVLLDLQAALDQAYDAAHYGNYIYTEEPQPPLSPDDVAWARQFMPPHN
jgi:hypothetical protein